MWRETRIGLEAAALRRSPVFRGLGLAPGDRRPVLLIPGFMAGDASLGTMSQWLRRAGYCTHRTGIRANLDCSEEACKRLEARLEHMAERHDERVVIIGQSRGGVFARALGARRPDLVSAIVTLGSPTQSRCSRSTPSCSPRSASSARSAPPTSRACSASAACAGSAATTSAPP